MLKKEDLDGIELVDNKKLNESILLLQELYSHMYKRIGIPNIIDGQGRWGNEGSYMIYLNINIPPYDEYKQFKNRGFNVVGITFNTNVLPRKHKDRKIQNFDTIDRFFEQVKNWHKYEMSLSLDDKNADYYIDTDH